MTPRRFPWVAALTLAACSVSKDPTYWALEPVRGMTAPPKARIVELRRPTIAGYLDRADIVRGVADHKLSIAADDDWAEPLGDMIARVVAVDLRERLPGTAILGEDGPVAARSDVTVAIDVQRLDADVGGDVVLAADVVAKRREGEIVTRHVEAREKAGADTAELVGTMSRLLGRLADSVAEVVVAVTASPARSSP